MSRHKADDIEEVDLMSTVPLDAYKLTRGAYRWPKKNKCPVCLVGKFKHIEDTTIIVCKSCDLEIHIPHEA